LRHFGAFPARPPTLRFTSPRGGQAPHARERGFASGRGIAPLGHRAFVCPQMIMLCPGLRPALPRGRTECVPPRKPPIARSPGLSPQGHLTPASPPGGAGSARPQGRPCLHREITPLGNRVFVYRTITMPYSTCVRPVFAGAETPPLRENHFSRHFGAFPARRPTLRFTLPRRGGLCTPGRRTPA
jgi:hypothetical protein